jgi:hypothetical protein
MLNNKLKNKLFLKACFNGDRKALDLWNVLYWPEVEGAVKIVVSKQTVGPLDPNLVGALVVDCTNQIYQQWRQIPSAIFDLKTRVRKYAISYTITYFKRVAGTP